jgi:crotonobetainyl-CoA:carnitine CoA-transferase CaiB-like acyl-CoA transferase
VVERGTLARLGEGEDSFLVANAPYRLSATPTSARPRLPGLGEHSTEVLREVLGLSPRRIDELSTKGVLGKAPQ